MDESILFYDVILYSIEEKDGLLGVNQRGIVAIDKNCNMIKRFTAFSLDQISCFLILHFKTDTIKFLNVR